jgi:hypothetical protein
VAPRESPMTKQETKSSGAQKKFGFLIRFLLVF